MKRFFVAVILLCLLLNASAEEYQRLSADAYKSHMTAGWLGQMAGVGWGAPVEFRFNGRIIPEDEMPIWKPEMINQFFQDDIYVEMTFIKSLEDYGWDVSYKQVGLDFAASKYPLWHANNKGRRRVQPSTRNLWPLTFRHNSKVDRTGGKIEDKVAVD